MKDISEALSLVFLWLVVALYVLIALLLFAHMLSGFVSRWLGGRRVKGPAHTERCERHGAAVSEAGARGMNGGGRHVRPWTARISASPPKEPAGVKAQAGDSVDREQWAAWHRL